MEALLRPLRREAMPLTRCWGAAAAEACGLMEMDFATVVAIITNVKKVLFWKNGEDSCLDTDAITAGLFKSDDAGPKVRGGGAADKVIRSFRRDYRIDPDISRVYRDWLLCDVAQLLLSSASPSG